ncbi:MAG TPA: protein-glutamate O-methyltransferase CheR [Rhizomicrobium sp.]|nr:protein-glutamate O-methyltransferase CheR [Rhizomicrobium sp.]
MTPEDFAYLALIVHRRSGIVLSSRKLHLIESRLSNVQRRFGFRSLPAMVEELRHGRDVLARAVTEALTTNDTSFFRDRPQFDQLRDTVLPRLMDARAASKRLRVWCAACASGQEPYSVAMLFDDMKLVEKGWSIDLIATDFSAEMVARAEDGLYSHFEVQRGLAIKRLVTHFTQEGGNWRVQDRLRRMVTFRAFNLLDSYGWLDDLDLVFCRNVLIYFDRKTKIAVLDKISEVLRPDGALLLGHAENTMGLSNTFTFDAEASGVHVMSRPSPQRITA